MNDEGFGVGAVLVFALLYFLPTIVAVARGHRSWGGIMVLDLFLGWTFIGWLIALVWACSSTGPAPVSVHVSTVQYMPPPPQYYPPMPPPQQYYPPMMPPPQYYPAIPPPPPALACGKCGALLTGDRQFCSACGTPALFLEGKQ